MARKQYFCGKHYAQMHEYGVIKRYTVKDKQNEYIVCGKTTKIALRNNRLQIVAYALIDTSDLPKVKQIKWGVRGAFHDDRQCYVQGAGGKYLLHRLILNPPRNMTIDHINHIRTDNRRSNLRIVSFIGNVHNQLMQKSNNSGVTGVHYIRTRKDLKKRWLAFLDANGKRKCSVWYSFEDAVRARKEMEKDNGFIIWERPGILR